MRAEVGNEITCMAYNIVLQAVHIKIEHGYPDLAMQYTSAWLAGCLVN